MSRHGIPKHDRRDANATETVKALRKVGALVVHLGHPADLLVGFRRRWTVLEVKDGRKAPSRRELTDEELAFMLQCNAMELPYYVVTTVDQALECIQA